MISSLSCLAFFDFSFFGESFLAFHWCTAGNPARASAKNEIFLCETANCCFFFSSLFSRSLRSEVSGEISRELRVSLRVGVIDQDLSTNIPTDPVAPRSAHFAKNCAVPA
jgi:hypothetical protein